MRIDPQLPVQMVKTYGIDVPLATHWRKATCAEVECKAYIDGWVTMVSEPQTEITAIGGVPSVYIPKHPFVDPNATEAERIRQLRRLKDQDEARAYYIRHLSGREFTERADESGTTAFEFPAGQECFAPHKVRIDRPEIFLVRGGDHRGNPMRETRIHDRPEDWVEDFSLHQDAIATRIQRG